MPELRVEKLRVEKLRVKKEMDFLLLSYKDCLDSAYSE